MKDSMIVLKLNRARQVIIGCKTKSRDLRTMTIAKHFWIISMNLIMSKK